MSYPDTPMTGRVDSIGWGIAQDDGSTGEDLLPNINATFEWIRLARRVAVRIHLDKVPDSVKLRVGTTASVLVRTGTAGEKDAVRRRTACAAIGGISDERAVNSTLVASLAGRFRMHEDAMH